MTAVPATDVLVIGGGVAGAAAARACRARGASVRLLEARTPVETTTWQSGGMLAPKAEGLGGDLLRLGLEALAGYDAYVDGLVAATGRSIDRGRGLLLPVFADDPGDWLYRYAEARRSEGHPMAVVEPSDWPGPVPGERLIGGLHVPDEGWVDPRHLLLALYRDLARSGTLVEWQTPARALRGDDHGLTIETDRGERRAERVVVATGHRPAPFAGLGWPRLGTIGGDRGIMLRVHGVVPPGEVLYHHGATATTYLVPDPSGVRIGSTSAPFDERQAADPAEVGDLLARARRIWPGIAAGRLAETGVGFRPMGPGDGERPYVGHLDNMGRVWGLLGLHRNGILLAPTLAEDLVGQMLV